MDDKKYDSRYDGETTDKILDNAKAIMEQTTAEDGETVRCTIQTAFRIKCRKRSY